MEDIALYLDVHMIGSPNFVRFVYDGDGSDTPLAGPKGSANIERVFLDYFAAQGLPTEPTAFSGRSDYGPFIAVGIPAGGLFTGEEGIKTADEAAIYGGTAGDQYDPCYHLACDTFDNVNLETLDINADAVAAATLQYAMNTEDVNGEIGKGNFGVAAHCPIRAFDADRQSTLGAHRQQSGLRICGSCQVARLAAAQRQNEGDHPLVIDHALLAYGNRYPFDHRALGRFDKQVEMMRVDGLAECSACGSEHHQDEEEA